MLIDILLGPFRFFLSPPLQEILSLWVKNMLFERRVSDHTVRNYLQDLKSFFTFLQEHQGRGLTLQDLSCADLREFRSFLAYRLGEGVSHRSNARAVSSLKTFFKYLKKNHDIQNKSILVLRPAKFLNNLPRPLSPDEAMAVTTEPYLEEKNPWVECRDQALFSLLYGAGLRISEALYLTIGDIENADRFLTIKGKGNRERLVPLISLVKKKIEHYIDRHPHRHTSQSPLFVGTRGGPLNPTVAQRQLKRLRLSMGLP